MSKYLAAAVEEDESVEVLQHKLTTALSLGYVDEAKKVAAKLKQRAGIVNRFDPLYFHAIAVSK